MIIIFSKEGDMSTNNVIDWLIKMKQDFIRINCFDQLALLIEQSPLKIDTNNLFDNVKSVWYRRRPESKINYVISKNAKTIKDSFRYYSTEQNALIDSMFYLLRRKKWLNNWKNSIPNKLYQLQLAKNAGLKIPKSNILSNKIDLFSFYKKHGPLILKSIQDVMSIETDNGAYMQYTKKITQKDISNFPPKFFPTLFQKLIDKNLEIRSFFIDGEIFSMAICSSFDNQTKEDFRKYNDHHPNRVIPYCLPTTICLIRK